MGTNISKYKWTPVQNISNDTLSNPKVWPEATQTYTLKVASPEGCIASKPVIVGVISGIFVPSAFTPDNNGLNDYWGIRGLELYPGCHVKVFNRWGQVVYQSSGYTKPWDGTFKGQKLPAAAFFYIIDLKNGKKHLSGTVIIIG